MPCILIAEDEQLERAALAQALTEAFSGTCEILMAENGLEALSLAETFSPSLLLMDIDMPGLNGLEAARQIKQKLPRCKLIFLTAYSSFEYAQTAISIGTVEYLLKPLADAELVRTVGIVLTQLETELTRDARASYVESLPPVSPDSQGSQEELAPPEDLRLIPIRQAIETYLHQHFNENLSLSSVAENMHYSENYFSKLFKKCFHTNFVTFLANVRIEKACDLLRNPLVRVKDVSRMAGFRDANYFTKVFRQQCGMTPSEYRLRHHRPEREMD